MHRSMMFALYWVCSLSSLTMTHGFLSPQVQLSRNSQVKQERVRIGSFHTTIPSVTGLSMTATLAPTNSTYQGTPVITTDTNNNVLNQVDMANEPPTLAQVRKLLPAEVFKVDTKVSLLYFTVDLLAVAGTMGFLNQVVTSDIYHSLPWWNQAIMVAPLQVLTGFAMWCMWCIGMSSWTKFFPSIYCPKKHDVVLQIKPSR